MIEPPQALEAEQNVLGAMLIDRRAVYAATEQASADDLCRNNHRQIFEAIVAVSQKTDVDDLVFEVNDELRCRGELEAVGGTAYLMALVEGCASAANIDNYLKPVLRTATQRRIMALGEKLHRAGGEPLDDTGPLIELLERETIAIAQRGTRQGLVSLDEGLLPTFEEILRNFENKGAISGVPSGFEDLDRKTTGFHAGDFIVIGARPGMGKSSLGLQIAEYVARHQDKPVAFFSLEMSMQQITQRFLAMHARIDISSLRRGFVQKHFYQLGDAFKELKGVPLRIDLNPAPTMFEIRAKAHRIAAERGLSMVVVDYLQRVNTGGSRGNRAEAVGQIARDFKSLARELNVPVIALAQLNRGVEGRDDKRPSKSDLRESGDIESEADLIMMLYRESYYSRDEQEDRVEEVEIIIDKNRQGPTGTVVLGWRGQFTQFVQHQPANDYMGGYAQ